MVLNNIRNITREKKNSAQILPPDFSEQASASESDAPEPSTAATEVINYTQMAIYTRIDLHTNGSSSGKRTQEEGRNSVVLSLWLLLLLLISRWTRSGEDGRAFPGKCESVSNGCARVQFVVTYGDRCGWLACSPACQQRGKQ